MGPRIGEDGPQNRSGWAPESERMGPRVRSMLWCLSSVEREDLSCCPE